LQQRYSIQIRTITSAKALRLSTGFYNTAEEINTVVQALTELSKKR
jgi:selenocysteine lyase/cysteine desulfurase